MLAYLATRPGSPVPRSEIAYQLWPESSDRQACTNLRKTLLMLRRRLLAHAVELYAGELLPDCYTDWIMLVRGNYARPT